MRAAAGDVPGAELLVSGQAAIGHDLDPVFARDLKVGELYIAISVAALAEFRRISRASAA